MYIVAYTDKKVPIDEPPALWQEASLAEKQKRNRPLATMRNYQKAALEDIYELLGRLINEKIQGFLIWWNLALRGIFLGNDRLGRMGTMRFSNKLTISSSIFPRLSASSSNNVRINRSFNTPIS
jgi:hypothetical protein